MESVHLPMYARQNDDGVSVNESALCILCWNRGDGVDESHEHWLMADDVSGYGDAEFYPVGNPDAVCGACGALTLWEES